MNYFSALRQKLSEHFSWNKSRIELLSMIIFSLFTIKNISLPKLALGIETISKPDSIVKRIYRFLSLQTIEELSFARFVLSLLNLKKFILIIDRTNWEFGKSKLNILYLAISYNNIAIPVLLKMLDNKGGSSSTSDRVELLEKFLKLSGAHMIEALLGDREFFSEEWIKFLTTNNIKFVFRTKCNQLVRHKNGGKVPIKDIIKEFPYDSWIHFNRISLIYSSKVRISCKIIRDDYVILIYSAEITKSESVRLYKLRWEIESMFKAMKTQGFNIENTHITMIDRLSKMLYIIIIAFAFITKFGFLCHKIKPIKVKKHGRRLFSIFTYGLNIMHKILLSKIDRSKLRQLISSILDKQMLPAHLQQFTVRY